MHRARQGKRYRLLPKWRLAPKIPKEFLANVKIGAVLRHTITEFNYEEKQAICYYHLVTQSISEVAVFTGLPVSHVIGTLLVYAERLTYKLDVFKTAVQYDEFGVVDVKDMLEEEKIVLDSSDDLC